jgi:chromosome partitioning protein
VGKTTLATHLATAAMGFRKRALLVDLDPQAQCSTVLGVERGEGVYRVVWDKALLRDSVIQARPGCDLLPGTTDSNAALADQIAMDPRGTGVFRLTDVLEQQARGYDIVILDCPPTLGRLNSAALLAAHGLVIPAKCAYLSMESIGLLTAELREQWNSRHGSRAKILTVVPTFWAPREIASADAVELLNRLFKDKVSDPIPKAVAVERLAGEGLTIWQAANSKAAGLETVLPAMRRLVEWFYLTGLPGLE